MQSNFCDILCNNEFRIIPSQSYHTHNAINQNRALDGLDDAEQCQQQLIDEFIINQGTKSLQR